MSGYFANTGLIVFLGARFPGGGNILGARAFQDFFCSLCPLGIVGMN
jgi:hypothetical protein